jgi:CheY-like chemotaxis protein
MTRSSLILIVDDEPLARETLAGLLYDSGYTLEFAVNGLEGLQKARELYPDVILLDVMMPGMDGFEVCRRLRADSRLAEVPILMVTALDDRDSRLEGLRAGADDFLSKPFDSIELDIRLQTITRLNRYRRLLAERARFQWMAENTEEGFVLVDNAGLVQYANPQAQLYLNLPPDAYGRSFLELVRQQYHCEPEDAWQHWQTQGASARPLYLVRPETPTARAFWLLLETFNVPSAADVGRLVRLRDVTQALASQQEMRSFHTAILHKLRTPLAGIHMSLNLLGRHAAEMSGAEMADLANTAFKSVERLRVELEDVFHFISAPTLAQPGQGFALAQLRSVVAILGAELQANNVTVDLPDGLEKERLTLSQAAFEGVLWEILENAKKFHPQQRPAITIDVKSVNAQRVSVKISDDGLTLSPEQLQWAWTPYLQSEKHFTGQTPGMGLGLPLVATLVWQVGGAVRLLNRADGPGVVVDLTLPLA